MTETPPETGDVSVTLYRSEIRFPSLYAAQDDEIMVQVHRNDVFAYEFSVVHVGSAPGTVPIALRVQIFDDAWAAFADLPEFFALLASMNSSAKRGQASALSLDTLIERLVSELGWNDESAVESAAP